ncbi:MAG TPA: putative toxin-antitoxin system toxin component, PIN family [Paludibacter sp.]|nr:putative toxin-antitoxin system toxin component, PIN family [Paludibacter sp.]
MPRSLKIIIDTNLWISFLLTKQFSFLDKLLAKKKVRLIFSDELLAEFLEVVKRPKLSKYFDYKDLELLIECINQYGEFYSVNSKVEICRDEKDNFLLALAKESKANYLITGDKDLLILKKFENTEIITIAEYKIVT